jgi:ketosteroid isomerase-like protein
MDRDIAVALLDQLHAAQNKFYGGGGDAQLRDLLASGIAWTVPGNNSIAGVYRGTEAVFDYFRRRRDLAAGSFRMTRRDVLAGEGDRIAALTDGAATIDGMEHRRPLRSCGQAHNSLLAGTAQPDPVRRDLDSVT